MGPEATGVPVALPPFLRVSLHCHSLTPVPPLLYARVFLLPPALRAPLPPRRAAPRRAAPRRRMPPLRALAAACIAAAAAAWCTTDGSSCCDLYASPPTCANCCASLTSLTLAGGNATAFPHDMLWGLPALQSLTIRYPGTVSTLDVDFLRNATELTTVDITGDYQVITSLTNFPNYLFARQSKLTCVCPPHPSPNSSGARARTCARAHHPPTPSASLCPPTNISAVCSWLNIGTLPIRTLNADLFVGLTSLTYLRLQYNQFTILPPLIFCPLVNLETLQADAQWTFAQAPQSSWNASAGPLLSISCLPKLQSVSFMGAVFGAPGSAAVPVSFFASNSRLTSVSIVNYNTGTGLFPEGTFAWNPLLSTIIYSGTSMSAPFSTRAFCFSSNSSCCNTAASPMSCSGCCEGMTLLDLSSRGLASSTLPAGLFTPYSSPAQNFGAAGQSWASLTALSLRNNSLTGIDATVFVPAPLQLASIDLRDNLLPGPCNAVFTSVAALASAGCLCSSVVTTCCSVVAGVANCSGCCPWVTSLDLSSRSITTLSAAVFQGFSALTQLRLSGNSFTSLPAGVFANLSALQSIYLNSNPSLVTLPARLLASLPALSYATLSGARFAVLPESIFEGSTALATLDLGANPNLLGLPPALLSSLPLLSNLNLASDSALAAYPAGFFPAAWLSNQGGAYQLVSTSTALDKPGQPQCSCNCNSEVAWGRLAQANCYCSLAATSCCNTTASPVTCAGCCATMTALDLSGKSLSALPQGLFSGLPLLSSLSLAYNNITRLDALLLPPSAATLASIDLRGNAQMPAACRALFGNTSAIPADCLCSNLSSCCDTTASPITCGNCCPWTSALELSYKGITALPAGIFSGLTGVASINLAGNGLNTLPQGIFTGLTALTSVNLNGQYLTSLPSAICSGTAMTSLTANMNSIASLPADAFAGCVTLQSLDLSNNAISSLAATQFAPIGAALRTLNLNWNL